MKYKYEKITGKIINCAYEVHNNLGYGFLEKVYENALLYELEKDQMKVEQQKPIEVYYDGQIVGEYFCDLLVENKVVVELKSVERIEKIHEVQVVNYLHATNKELGLLINFGKSVEVKRKYKKLNRHD